MLAVGNELALGYVAYVSENQPLALGASHTPERLTLNRLDDLTDGTLPVGRDRKPFELSSVDSSGACPGRRLVVAMTSRLRSWGCGLSLVVAVLACGGKVEEQQPVELPTPPSVFTNPPVELRAREELGPVLRVPKLVAYLGAFELDATRLGTTRSDCVSSAIVVDEFFAQVYPWTSYQYRTCVLAGACPGDVLQPDSEWAVVTLEQAQAACRAHGAEVITSSQLAALYQGGQASMAWPDVERTVLSCPSDIPDPGSYQRCPRADDGLEPWQWKKGQDKAPFIGPFGHRGMTIPIASWVRFYPSAVTSTCKDDSLHQEVGDAMPARQANNYTSLVLGFPKGPFGVVAATVPSRDGASIRCAFRGP